MLACNKPDLRTASGLPRANLLPSSVRIEIIANVRQVEDELAEGLEGTSIQAKPRFPRLMDRRQPHRK
ncbi:hypothetical protein P245_03275 [Comamonas thiooxydans]|uniref:Uncharacterized protein n=1 Tax=Comamonas thiooxydans TaxID=363952 RepID=A0A0E3BJA5_9BURK|nr:hypothetical protein P245_03275 [Comamonas thiooxydans]